MNPQLLQLLITLVESSVTLAVQMQRVSSLVQRLQAEGRDPTAAEWAEIDAGFDQSRSALQEAIAHRQRADASAATTRAPATSQSP